VNFLNAIANFFRWMWNPPKPPQPDPVPPPVPPAPPVPPEPEPQPEPQPEPAPQPEYSEDVRQLLNAHNQARNSGALQINRLLMSAAQKHATWMAQYQRMSHMGAGGSDVMQRVQNEGYQLRAVGENVAYGYRDVNAVMDGWMNSSGHRRNITNRAFTEVGFGIAKTAAGTIYWCTVFGTPSGAGARPDLVRSETHMIVECPAGIAPPLE
jgi:uncharacterized protein YkwD